MNKFKIGDRIILQNLDIYSNMSAKIIEKYKDTYKIIINGFQHKDLKIISEEQILKKL
ncbi:MAG: hypothetical protein AABY22_24790 [Nanoarchaeota archaeon]